MTSYIIRRLLFSIPVIFLMILATFLLVNAMPGGPFDSVGERPMPEHMKRIMENQYGLNDPLYEQFFKYTWRLMTGDLGPLFERTSQNVNDVVKDTFPVSIQLGTLSLILGFSIGVPAGIIAALKHNSAFDYFATFSAVFLASVPNLVLAPILIYVFTVYLRKYPSLPTLPTAFWGAEPPFRFGIFPRSLGWDFWRYTILPVIALGTAYSAGIARLTRAGLLEILNQDYIRTARAKGLREQTVILIHALKNSLIPLATIVGPLLAGAVTGAFVVEQIFAINGMGREYLSSINKREYFLVTSLTLIFGTLLIVGNIFVDILYAWLDPRIRYD